jgi:hypothetical protein
MMGTFTTMSLVTGTAEFTGAPGWPEAETDGDAAVGDCPEPACPEPVEEVEGVEGA